MGGKFKIRRQLLAMRGADIRGANVTLGDGGTTDYFRVNASGHLSLAGTARVYKEFYIPAVEFTQSGCAAQGNEGPWFIPGSAIAASHAFETGDLTGTCGPIFSSTSAASATVIALQAACNITGSMWYGQATFPVPTDAATTGSLVIKAIWTSASDPGTSGCVAVLKAGLVYVSSSAAVRACASTGACPAYNYTASNVVHETSLSAIASFSTNDVLGILTIGHDPAATEDKLNASPIRILGVKVRYLSDSLGTQS